MAENGQEGLMSTKKCNRVRLTKTRGTHVGILQKVAKCPRQGEGSGCGPPGRIRVRISPKNSKPSSLS
jgi:hypothetical protein